MTVPTGAHSASAPYPGLRSFRGDEAELFFGREQQTDQLLDRLQKTRFLAIVGPSGCGKSSLVRAGMIAALQAGFMAGGSAHWRIAQMRPGARPLWRLASALAEPLALDLERKAGPTGIAFADATLRRGPLGLVELLQEQWLPEDASLLLLIDQFEEIFRFREEGSTDEADAFIALLLASAAQSAFPVYVVLTMRSDFLGDCAIFQGLPEAINEGQYLTPRMTREQTRSAIVGPARVFDGNVEPALVTQLLNEVGTDPDQLPLLQHALMRMWQQMQERTRASEERGEAGESDLTMDDYRVVGSIAKALSIHANQVYDSLAPAQQRIAELMFRRLTHRATGRRDTRRPARLDDVAAVAGATVEEVCAVVEEFRRPDRSFVTPPAGIPLTADTVLDIGHESLIRQWDRLNAWVDAEAKSADIYFRLRDSAAREQLKRAALWRSPELEEGLAWRDQEAPNAAWAKRYGTSGDFELSMLFVERSAEQQRIELEVAATARREREALELERREERERRLEEQARAGRKFRWLFGAAALVAVFAFGAFYEATVQKRRADEKAALAVVRQLNAEAAAALADSTNGRRVVRGLLLALASLKSAWTADAYETLVSHIDLLPQQPGKTWQTHNGEVRALAVSLDGRWLASAGSRQTQVQALDGNAAVITLEPQHGSLQALAFSADSRWLAAGCGHGREICIYDTTGWQVGRRLAHGDGIRSLSFDPQRGLLASASYHSPVVKIYDTGSWTEREPISTDARAAAFIPNSELIATSGGAKVALWKPVKFGKYDKLVEIQGNGARSLVSSADGRFLAIGSQLIEMSTDEKEEVRLTPREQELLPRGRWSSAAFSPDGRYLAGTDGDSGADGFVHIVDVAAGLEVSLLPEPAGAVVFTKANQLVVGNRDGAIVEWELAQLAEKSAYELPHDAEVRAVAFSPDGRWLATSSAGQLRIFKTGETREARSIGLQAETSGIAFTPDGRWLVTGVDTPRRSRVSRMDDAKVSIFDTSNWRQIGPLQHDGPVARIALSSDGRWIATVTPPSNPMEEHSGIHRQAKLRVWDAVSGVQAAWMLDAKTDGKPKPIDGGAGGPTEPTSGGDTALAEQAASWAPIFTADREDRMPNVRWLTSKTTQETELSAASRERAQRAHEETIEVAYSGDGRWLASGGKDRSVRLWHLMPEDLANDACGRLPRNLTCAEWRKSSDELPYMKTCPGLPDPPDIAQCSAGAATR